MVLRQLHDASRFGVVSLNGDVVTAFRERPKAGYPGVINSGLYLFNHRIMDLLKPVCSLEADIMPLLASRGTLRGVQADGYFRDIGVPEDFARAQVEIPALLHRRALFLHQGTVLDLDRGGAGDRFAFTRGALGALCHATRSGWHVFVLALRSGRAADDDGYSMMDWLTDEVRRAGGTIDDIRYFPHRDEGVEIAARSQRGKSELPLANMLRDIGRAWELNPAQCIMIGHNENDKKEAAAAGVRSCLFLGDDLFNFIKPIVEHE
jgi:D-glycero-D-manno-heptose 1,7-bisphosphate phosphatase